MSQSCQAQTGIVRSGDAPARATRRVSDTDPFNAKNQYTSRCYTCYSYQNDTERRAHPSASSGYLPCRLRWCASQVLRHCKKEILTKKQCLFQCAAFYLAIRNYSSAATRSFLPVVTAGAVVALPESSTVHASRLDPQTAQMFHLHQIYLN